MNHLLETRNKLKRKKPKFLRQDAHKRKRLSQSWRRPRGIHSKMREQIKGRRRSPRIGWGSPRAVRGLTREGFVPVHVHNVSQLATIAQPLIISRTVGTKNRMLIIKKAMEKKLKILNIKDPQAYLAQEEKKFQERKQQQKTRLDERKKTEEAGKKQAEPEKKEETIEQKEAREKEEKRKILEGKA